MASDTKGTTVGIVVSPEATVLAQVRVRGGQMEVVSWGAITTPEDSMDGAAIADATRVSAPIRLIKRDINSREKLASVSLLAPGYGMRAIRLPDVPETERRTLVRGELEDAAALPVGAGAFDMLWVPVVSEDGKRQADVSAYFVHDHTVEATNAALRLSGFEPDVIEPASVSMFRLAIAASGTGSPVALICPAEKHSDLCVHDGKRIRLLRRIPAGWSDLYQAAEKAAAETKMLGRPDDPSRPAPELGVPAATGIWSEEGDFPSVFNEPKEQAAPIRIDAEPDTGPVAGLERTSPTQFLASEVTRTLAFYIRENPDAPRPDSLMVLGPAAVVRDFRSALHGSISLPISSVNPMANVQVPEPAVLTAPADTAHLLMAAVGVALGTGNAEASVPVVDISQQELAARGRRRAPVMLLAGMAGSTLWMIGAAAAAITLSFLQSSAENENSRINAEIKKIKDERAALLKASELGYAAKAAFDKSNVPAAAILGRVAASVVPGVSVNDIKVSPDGKVTVGGKAENEARLEEFIVMLTRGSTVRGPVSQTIRIDRLGITFSVVGVFRDKAA